MLKPIILSLALLSGIPFRFDPLGSYSDAVAKPDVTDSMILWAKFDGNALDSSGTGNNALTDNCADGGAGVDGNCYYFSGAVNKWVIFPVTNSTPRLGQTVTFTAWVKPIQASNYRGVAMGKSNLGLCLFQFENTAWSVKMYAGSWTTYHNVPAASIPTNTWTHVAFSVKGGAGGYAKTYVNGVQYSTTYNITSTIPHDSTFYIGCAYVTPDRFFYGYMDEIRLYTRNLSDAEILTVYNKFKP